MNQPAALFASDPSPSLSSGMTPLTDSTVLSPVIDQPKSLSLQTVKAAVQW